MPILRNISTKTQTVGGWQEDQDGSLIPNDKFGFAQHRVYTLPPGGEIEIPNQIVNHPIIENLIASGKFKIFEATVVPGGAVEEDPASPKGELRKLEFVLTDTMLTAAAASQSIQVETLPKGALPLHALVEVEDVFDGGTLTGMTVSLGDLVNPTSLSGAADVLTATGTSALTLNALKLPLGLDVVATVTATGGNVSDVASPAKAILTVVYAVV